MDNINVIRDGFNISEFKISDINGGMHDPIDRSGDKFTCLVFVNPDKNGAELINKLENNLPDTASGFKIGLSAIVPIKLKLAKRFKDDEGLGDNLYCDRDLRVGKQFSIIDSSQAQPSYHPFVFVIGNDGSVRYKQAFEPSGFDMEQFRSAVSELI
ncbi:MAG: hypothetical protein J7K40_03885 [candidate division Zixibacteria bacterium]|nr:hypothetical protein [candidate division Zixibacteria bacterium]